MTRMETRLVFAERLKKLMEEKGLTAVDVGKGVGVGAESVRKWLRAKSEPETHRFESLAQLFGVSAGWLQFGDWGSEVKIIDMPCIRTVPLVSLNGFEKMVDKVVSGVPVSDKAFGFIMTGESMEPVIQEGWTCIVDPEIKPIHGDIVLYDREGHGICRTLIHEGGEWILKPENARYDLIKNVPFENIKGTVVYTGKALKKL